MSDYDRETTVLGPLFFRCGSISKGVQRISGMLTFPRLKRLRKFKEPRANFLASHLISHFNWGLLPGTKGSLGNQIHLSTPPTKTAGSVALRVGVNLVLWVGDLKKGLLGFIRSWKCIPKISVLKAFKRLLRK